MNDITALAQLRAELTNPAIGNKDHIRKIALSLVEALEAADALNKHLELAIRKAEGCSEALRRKTEAAEKRIADLESRTVTVKFEPIPVEQLGNVKDGKKHPYMFGAGYNCAVVHCESVMLQALAAAGIQVIEGEGQ